MRPLPRFLTVGWIAAIAALLPVASLHAAPASPPTTYEIIAKVLEAYGGRAALDTVRAVRCEGSVFAVQRHEDSPTVRVFQRPDRFKILIGYATASEVRIVDGAKGWRSAGGDTIRPASGVMLDAMVLQAARCNLPWILAERESLVRLVEPDSSALVKLDGKNAVGLEVPLANGLVLRAYLDAATSRVAFSEGVLSRGAMAPRFEVLYSDYRQVNGVWFAFKEQSSASGMQTGVTTIKSVVVNPPIRGDEFMPPPPATKKKEGTSG